jgi:hypothetical protein
MNKLFPEPCPATLSSSLGVKCSDHCAISHEFKPILRKGPDTLLILRHHFSITLPET